MDALPTQTLISAAFWVAAVSIVKNISVPLTIKSVIFSDALADANFLLTEKLPVVSIVAINASYGLAELVFV